MKSADQIAKPIAKRWKRMEYSADEVRDIRAAIVEAIETDRRQHNVITAIADCLDDRDARTAAQLVRDTDPDDDLWNNYVGPVIDSIQDDYTKIAHEMWVDAVDGRACTEAGEHLKAQRHRYQECPVYHEGE